jgi:hypothetical protein
MSKRRSKRKKGYYPKKRRSDSPRTSKGSVQLTTPEGDAIVFTSAHYRHAAQEEISAILQQAAGEQVELPLLNEQRTLEQLTRRRDELERELRQERNLTVGEPRFLGAAVVVPLVATAAEEMAYDEPQAATKPAGEGRSDYGAGMQRDDEIEAVGMQMPSSGSDWSSGRVEEWPSSIKASCAMAACRRIMV